MAISSGHAPMSAANCSRRRSISPNHGPYQAAAPEASHNSVNCRTPEATRVDSAPNEQVLKYVFSWQIGNSARYFSHGGESWVVVFSMPALSSAYSAGTLKRWNVE